MNCQKGVSLILKKKLRFYVLDVFYDPVKRTNEVITLNGLL